MTRPCIWSLHRRAGIVDHFCCFKLPVSLSLCSTSACKTENGCTSQPGPMAILSDILWCSSLPWARRNYGSRSFVLRFCYSETVDVTTSGDRFRADSALHLTLVAWWC